MLAYSSVAHTGYLLVGIIAAVGSPQTYFPVMIYLTSYVAVNIGTFAVLTMISKKMDTGLNLHDLSGLAKKYPALGFAMAVFMFSMAGIPPTGGFLAKYFIFYSAVQSGEVLLTVIAVLCSAVSVYYYLRVLVYMYMREPIESGISENRFSLGSWLTIAASLILIFQLGLFPSGIINIAKRAVTGF
jgi:NADH-quinone oxidoreductase subunit N